jgi:hypothetical protein
MRYLALNYECPAPLLIQEHPLIQRPDGQGAILGSGIEPPERFQGALFAHAVAEISDFHVHIGFDPAANRAPDEDCVARWAVGDDFDFAPVQLKLLVSAETNPAADLEADMNRKLKDCRAPKLHFVWTINREITLHPSKLKLPNLHVAGVWIQCGVSRDGKSWMLHGNFVDGLTSQAFTYPAST